MGEDSKTQRRACRVAAMQYLYSWSINPPEELSEDLRLFFDNQEKERDYYSFAEELIFGAAQSVKAVDDKIMELARNWEFDRIARIDLAILRVAVFEMLYRKDIPPVVTINEAIDLSKDFSSEESRRFINGILDKLKDQLNRPARSPSVD